MDRTPPSNVRQIDAPAAPDRRRPRGAGAWQPPAIRRRIDFGPPPPKLEDMPGPL